MYNFVRLAEYIAEGAVAHNEKIGRRNAENRGIHCG